MYDLQTKENYGWVLIPDEPNVPPSLQKVAVCLIKFYKISSQVKRILFKHFIFRIK